MFRNAKCLFLAAMLLLVAACGGGGGGSDTPTGDVTVSLSYNPPAGTVGTFYKYSPSYSSSQSVSEHFVISGGSLPPGLGISAGDGVISGTPTTPGFYSFTVNLSASGVTGSVSRSGSITIYNPAGSGSSSSAFSFSSSSSAFSFSSSSSAFSSSSISSASSSSVSSAATLSVSLGSVTLGGANGRAVSSATSVTLDLNRTGSYTWTVTSKPTWLTLSKSTGTLGTSTDTVALTMNPSLMSVGTNTGLLALQAIVGASTLTANVAVTANLDKHKLIASDVGVALSKTPAWSRLTKTLTVRDSFGSGSWTAASNQSWLTVTPAGSSGGALTLTADTTGLTADQIYAATVTLTSSTGASSETVSVGLWNGSSTPPARVTISASYSQLIADPVRPLAYVHNGSGAIDIYNIYTAASVGSITVAGTLGRMQLSQDGKRLYVATGTTTVAEIDPIAKSVLGTWTVSSLTASADLLYVRPNGEGMLIAGSKAYSAATGALVSTGSPFASGAMSVSAAQDTVVALTRGTSPSSLYAYGIDYSAITGLSVVAGMSRSAAGNAKAVAISRDGLSVLVAGGGDYEFGRLSLPGLVAMSPLTAAAYPNNVRVASDGRIFGGIFDWYGATDFWVYRADGTLHSSYLLRGYAKEILDNQLSPSGDALMAVALTATPNLQFVAVGP